MSSPAQRHQMRMQASQATAHAAPGRVHGAAPTSPAARIDALMRAKLDTDRRRLSDVQSVQRKIEVKAKILPDYADYIAGVLAADKGGADDIVGYVMCWRIDVGDFAGALDIARYVLKHNLSLPDRFQRTPATLVAEEPAVQALKAYDAQKPFDIDVLRQVEAITRDRDMPDQVRAKLLFAMGRWQMQDEPAQALANLRRAVELHDKVGAKKDIEQLERRLRKEQSPNGDT